MADFNSLSELLRQAAYLQGGGMPEGQRPIDKLNTTADTIGTAITNVLAQKKAKLEAQKTTGDIAKTGLETQALGRGLQTTDQLKTSGGLTPKEDLEAAQAEYYRNNQGKTPPRFLPVSTLPALALKRVLATGKYKPDDMIAVDQFNALKAEPGTSEFANVRGAQNIITGLPSNQSSGNAAGAASQVQLAARQGKSLIANPGSPQRLSLAASDLARAVQRSAPQLETLRGSGFADNLLTKISMLKQKVDADPSSSDVPKLRKEIYDILSDLENASRPVISRQMDAIQSIYKDRLPADWQDIRRQQTGEDLPEIPFNEMAAQTGSTLPPDKEQRYQELLLKKQAGTIR